MNDEQQNLFWYALKVFYNKFSLVEKMLQEDAVESYIPKEKTVMEINGRKVTRERPVINSLMFVRCSEDYVRRLQHRLINQIIVYSHRETRRPAAIPEREMRVFILVTSAGDSGLEYFGDERMVNYSVGDRVRVTGGIFEGAEGYIRRIKGNRRLVVAIQGVVAVATSYIPSCFLEKA